MLSVRQRIKLALVIVVCLGLGLLALYRYLQTIEPQVLGVVDRFQDNLENQLQAPSGLQEKVLVSQVVDGDTIKLIDGRTVRYIGIDTPETKHPTKKVECFGKEAAERNRALVEGKFVTLQKDVSETDRYGRLLRYVYVGEQEVNRQLVAEGYAYSSSYPPDIAHQADFQNAEITARTQKAGLWDACPL